jgi:hypothetical protein
LLAECLLDAGQRGEARQVLDAALREHHYAPTNSRWRNWRWAPALARAFHRLHALPIPAS